MKCKNMRFTVSLSKKILYPWISTPILVHKKFLSQPFTVSALDEKSGLPIFLKNQFYRGKSPKIPLNDSQSKEKCATEM